MPYQAAKAIAATFCYNIRWALTPVFGNDFPTMCVHPTDPNYAKFLIDPDIVRECTEETNRFRREGPSYKTAAPQPSAEPYSPKLQFGCPPWGVKVDKAQHQRTSEEESGYASDTRTDRSGDDGPLFSPQVSPRSQTWRSVNRSQSPASPTTTLHSPTFGSPPRSLPPLHQLFPTSVPDGYYGEPFRTKRTHSKVAFCDEHDDEASRLPTEVATADSDSEQRQEDGGDGLHTRRELDAAKIILQLSAADKALPPTKRTRRSSRY